MRVDYKMRIDEGRLVDEIQRVEKNGNKLSRKYKSRRVN